MSQPSLQVRDYLARVERLGPLIRESVAESQRDRRLPPVLVEAFHEEGLFRILIAKEFGGAGLSELEAAAVVEAVARHDASAAWSVMIAASSAGYARALAPAVQAEILGGPRTVIAGVINPHTLRFSSRGDGYVVTGRAPFASGCTHANWFGAGGMLVGDPQGSSRFKPSSLLVGFVPATSGEILDTWNVTGLRGSGSNEILFSDVFIPASRVADHHDVPATRAGATIAAVAIGTAHHALAEFRELAAGKLAFGTRNVIRDRADAQIAFSRATGLVEAARALMTSFMADYPDRTSGGPLQTPGEEALLRLACVTAADLSVQAVDLIHTAAGTSTLPENSVIGLCWRDVHAVQQNLSVQPKHYQSTGEVLLGARKDI
ncbi:MAG: acyl-CoA dehydrogenase family protein [bacterium]